MRPYLAREPMNLTRDSCATKFCALFSKRRCLLYLALAGKPYNYNRSTVGTRR